LRPTALRYFHTAAAAPAPSKSDKPPSIGALLGSSGGYGWAAAEKTPSTNKEKTQKAKQKIKRELNKFFMAMRG